MKIVNQTVIVAKNRMWIEVEVKLFTEINLNCSNRVILDLTILRLSGLMISAEGMSNGRGAAFTLVQREELERQTMIFKYMMASVPVPPQLLLPLTKNQRE